MAGKTEGVRKKAVNFNEEEKLALTEAIRDKREILFGKLTPNITRHVKEAAWESVVEAVNAVSSIPRNLSQIQEKYKNMKKFVKSAAAHNNREIRKTGGGPAEIKKFDESEDNILATLPATAISGIEGGIDSSDFHGLDTKPAPVAQTINDLSLPATFEFDANAMFGQKDAAKLTVVLTDHIPSTSTSGMGMGTPDTPQYKIPKRVRDLRNPTEILLEKQVNLVEKQVNVMSNILKALERRNEIEEEKLLLKKRKYGED